MIKIFSFIRKIIVSSINRIFGTSFFSPWHMVLYITYACQLKCKTCDFWAIYKREPSLRTKELNLDEYRKIFSNAGFIPYISIVGGEPFLKIDFAEICKVIIMNSSPIVLAITTNGYMGRQIVNQLEEILPIAKQYKTKISLQISVDAYQEKHDRLRGIKGTYKNLKETFNASKKLTEKYNNFSATLQTTLSRFNISGFLESYDHVSEDLEPDAYGVAVADDLYYTEILNYKKTKNPIKAELAQIEKVLREVKKKTKLRSKNIVSKLSNLFRMAYYDSKGNNKDLSCYSGVSSIVLDAQGGLLPCPNLKQKAHFLGNIRNYRYSLKNAWSSDEIKKARRFIKSKKCSCRGVCLSQVNLVNNLRGNLKLVNSLRKLF